MAAQDLKSGTGMVLGKFYPPTLGHQYLVEFARNYVEDLTVIVGSLLRETIPGELRVSWMRELFPDVRIVHLTDENPQYPREHPDFWQIWHDSLRRFIPQGPDFVFASDEYGFKLAEVLGARYVPVDHTRTCFPVSGSAVRQAPWKYWDLLPSCVRPYFLRRIGIIGPESTGKTVLAERLAKHYRTLWVPEYARGCIDAHHGRITAELFELFLRGQAASEQALARQANRILICDSDALTTSLYYELHIGPCPEYIRAEVARSHYDFYLVTTPDTPYVADSQRFHQDKREWFLERCMEFLEKRCSRYELIGGSWEERFHQACRAIDRFMQEQAPSERA
jgi:HTH-type transcriptional regulator, transcriptional repressor of NAD biosynthesis genes